MNEVRIRIRGNEPQRMGLVRSALVNLGFPETNLVEQKQRTHERLSYYTESGVQARRVHSKIRALKLKGISLSLILLKDADWKTRWKKYFKPFYITRRVRIVPAGYGTARFARLPHDLYIDTTSAFGSGLHATTRMMASFIASKKGGFGSFLDVGTGSGILSLLAWRCGCRDIWALDIDPECVKTSRSNFTRNACRPAYLEAVPFERFKPGRRFDFIAANLLTEDLLRLRGKLSACLNKGGYLAVSGIYRDNYGSFREGFACRGLKCRRAVQQKGWHALLFQRTG